MKVGAGSLYLDALQQCMHTIGIHIMFLEPIRIKIRKFREFTPFLYPFAFGPLVAPSQSFGL